MGLFDSLRRRLGLARPHADDLLAQAQALLQAGDVHSANACFIRVLEVEKPNVQARIGMAWCLRQMGGPMNMLAVLTMREALQLAPTDAAVVELLGIVLSDSGDHRGALEQFERLTALKPTHADGPLNAGNALYALGRHDEAVQRYRLAAALALNPSQALTNLGAVLIDQGDYQAAREPLQLAVTTSSPDVLSKYFLGRVELQLNNAERGRALLTAFLSESAHLAPSSCIDLARQLLAEI